LATINNKFSCGWLLQGIYEAYNTRSKKFSPKKQKGFRDGISYSTPQKSEETRGNAITQLQSHPIKNMVEFCRQTA